MSDNDKDEKSRQFQEEVERGLARFETRFEIAVDTYVKPLAKLLKDNPEKAIDLIFGTYNKTVHDAYEDEKGDVNAFCMSLGGGPHENVTWPLYNAVGAIYPYLERPLKDKALSQILNILDRINTLEITGERGGFGHTPGIRESLLISDICIVRPYFPGVEEGKFLLKKYPLFSDFRLELMDKEGYFKQDKVKSDALLAWAILSPDVSSFGKEYKKAANPNFFDRAIKGLVAYYFGSFMGRAKEGELTKENIQEKITEVKEWTSEIIHDNIEQLVKEHDWVDYKKFR